VTAPTVVITETIGLTNLAVANTGAETWTGFRHSGGGTPTPQNETDIFIQGSQAVSIKTSGSTRDEGVWIDTGAGTVDMTVAGRHFYAWALITTMSQMDAIASGGLYIIIGSSATNWNKYYVGGSDVSGSSWKRYVIDCNKTPSETSATPATLTAIRWWGIGVKSASVSAKSENVVIDRIDYGNGLAIEDGDSTDPATWQELFDADNNISNKYGIIQQEPNGTFTLLGGVRIGDDSGTKTSLWNDQSGDKVFFGNPLYHNGSALVSAVDSDALYVIEGRGNTTGTTDIDFGSVVGSGDSRQGILGGTIGSAGPKFAIDFETDIAHLDTVNFYGTTFENAGIMSFSSSTKTDVIGCTLVNCGRAEPNTCEFLNITLVAPVPDRGVEIVSGTGVKNVSFIAGESGQFDATRVWQADESATPDSFVEYTDEAASATAADVLPFPATEAANDYFCIGADSKFESLSIDVGTVGAGGAPAITWEYWTGSAWTALAGVTDNTNAFTTSGVNTVVWTDDTDDWEATSLNGERPLFYVRARLTSVYSTTNPILDEAHPVDKIEHHAHFPSTTGSPFTAASWAFFGFGSDGAPKWHAVNNSGGSLTVSPTVIAEITEAETEDIGAASTTVSGISLSITFINLQNGGEIRIYRVSDGGEEDGIESITGGQFIATLNSGVSYNVVVIHSADATQGGSVPIRREGQVYTASVSIDLGQISPDPNQSNP
jgi:hypothetical protein